MKYFCAACVLMSLVIVGCATEGRPPENGQREVRGLLEQQQADWNAGNLEGFMRGYAVSDSTRFASGGDVLLGWQTVFERYRRKYGGDKETMGTLKFSDVDVQAMGPASAYVFGRWHLTRKGTNMTGLYTLVLRKTAEGWRIVHDHTSSASP